MNNSKTIQKYSIVHIIDRLHTGGAERVLVTLANIFFEHGHKVKVVTIAEKGPLAAQLLPGIQQVNLGRKFKFNPLTMRGLIKETVGFDVVHVHSFFNLGYLWLAKTLFGLNKPLFYHEHFGFRARTQPTFWQKYILPKTIFIATTSEINTWATTQLHIPQNRVFTLPNIVLKERIEQVRSKKTGLAQLVLVSNIRREKNIEFAITLLQQLNMPDALYELTIIGKQYDKVYFNHLQQLVKETGTGNSVSFIHDANNVQQLLQNFDIGLHTSPSESGPLAIIEYLAQGLPFIAYNTGEVITPIKAELLNCIAFAFDTNEWISKIHQLQSADQPALKQQLELIFNKHFSAEAYYQQCIAIYQKGLVR